MKKKWIIEKDGSYLKNKNKKVITLRARKTNSVFLNILKFVTPVGWVGKKVIIKIYTIDENLEWKLFDEEPLVKNKKGNVFTVNKKNDQEGEVYLNQPGVNQKLLTKRIKLKVQILK